VADESTLSVLIRSVLDAKGFEDLQKRLKDAETGTQQAAGGAKDLSEAISGMGEKLLAATGIVLGTTEAIAFLSETFKAFVENEKILNQFDATNRILGKDIADNTAKNREWLESLELASAQAKTELVPSYQRLVAVTGDVSEAQRLTTIAANAAKAGLTDVAGATQALIRYMETGQTGTRGFGAVLRSLKGNTDDV
jgi:hypothetical protein